MGPRVGFLGAGLIAGHHAAGLRRAGVDLGTGVVWDPDRQRRDRFAAATGAHRGRSEDDVVDQADAVYVCTWTSEHPRLVTTAVDRGRAVFCEKPLATDLAAARAVAEAVTAAGVVNQVGLVLRRSPAFTLVRDLIADDRIGRVLNVVFRDDQYLPMQGLYDSTWRGDPARAGSGVLLEHSIHDVDLLEHVVGPVTSVSARTAEGPDHPGIEDAVAATVTFAAGGLGLLASSWHDRLDRPNCRRLEVVAERLMVVCEHDWWGPVWWSRGDGSDQVLSGADLAAEVDRRGLRTGDPDGEFIEAVTAGRPAWPDVGDAIRAHQLVDAAYRSAAAGGIPIEPCGTG